MPAAQRSLAIGLIEFPLVEDNFITLFQCLKQINMEMPDWLASIKLTHLHDYDTTRIKILGTPRPCLFVF